MAGQLTIDTLRAGSGVLATQNGMTGIAKAWVQVQTSGSTPTINGTFNVSSVTRTGTGAYTFAFTTAMANINYSVVSSGSVNQAAGSNCLAQLFSQAASPYYTAPLTTGFNIQYQTTAGSGTDPVYFCVAVLGS